MPVKLLLILAMPAIGALFRGRPEAPTVLIGLGFVYSVASLIFVARMRPKVKPPDEAEGDRILSAMVYALAALLGAIAFTTSLFAPFWAVALLLIAVAWLIAWWPPAMRTSTLTTAVDIRREPAEVFAFVSDLRNLLRYWPYYEYVEKLTADPIAAGTQFESHLRFPKGTFGLKEDLYFQGIEEIVQFEPPERLATRVSDRPRPNLAVFTFDAIPRGTRLTHSFTFQASYSSAVAGGELLGPKAMRRMRASRPVGWARAKEILESGTA